MPVTRLYQSEHDVNVALQNLTEAEIPRDIVMVIRPDDPNAAGAVDAGVDAGAIRKGQGGAVKAALARGRWVVAAKPSWTIEGLVEEVFDEAGAIEQDSIPEIPIHNPAPFSELLGLPVLIESKSHTGLLKFEKDSSFGLHLVINNPTPWSSLFRLPVLKPPTVSRLGAPMLKSPTVSRLGMPMLRRPRKSAQGTAISRLSRTPAPLSRFLGLPVLSKRR